MKRALISGLLTLLLFSVISFALAVDLSGKWNGSLEFKSEDGLTQSVPAHAVLKQQNKTVTGKIWKEEGQQFEIEQGQVTDKEISFIFHAPEGEDKQVLIHSVKLNLLSPTQLQGTLEFDAAGQKVSGKLTFTREK
jgi:hypothetical protein